MSELQPLSSAWFTHMGELAYVAAYDKNTDVIRMAVAEALDWAADNGVGCIDIHCGVGGAECDGCDAMSHIHATANIIRTGQERSSA